MASGFFGASFFMLIQLQQKLSEGDVDDVRDLWTYRMLILRCIVGIGAASILYFFFKSGLLEGSLWPKLTELGFEEVVIIEGDTQKPKPIPLKQKAVPNLNFSLLVDWSFLAGYSQTLVPNLLLKTENRTTAD